MINFIRARKLATYSGMTMNALRLILNAPELNPNAKILLDKKQDCFKMSTFN